MDFENACDLPCQAAKSMRYFMESYSMLSNSDFSWQELHKSSMWEIQTLHMEYQWPWEPLVSCVSAQVYSMLSTVNLLSNKQSLCWDGNTELHYMAHLRGYLCFCVFFSNWNILVHFCRLRLNRSYLRLCIFCSSDERVLNKLPCVLQVLYISVVIGEDYL